MHYRSYASYAFCFREKYLNKPVVDWISAPSPNFVAMATRVGRSTFCMVPLNRPSPKTPQIGPNIPGLSAMQADL